jgi:outer membrane receptor protein involved in Fe transport
LPTFKHRTLNLNRSLEEWTMINSFRAAHIAWDRTINLAGSQRSTERYFDYEEFPLQQFYDLILETNQNFQTATLEHETIIGLEINKNPFLVSGEGIDTSTSPIIPLISNASVLPSPYLTQDFISKKNYLGVFIEHEIALSDRLSLSFEGTLDVVIGDTAYLPELPAVEPIENNNFYPELSLDYQLTDNVLLFTTVNYAAEPIEGTDISDREAYPKGNRPFKSEVYRGLELGIETKINNNLLATLSFYHETQDNIITIDPNEPDFELQINEQANNSWMGEISGEIIPGWWIHGFYSYTDATVTEDEIIPVGSLVEGVASHNAGLWTSYEIPQGIWKGLGFGGGITWNSDKSNGMAKSTTAAQTLRPGDTANSFTLPSYLQTDAAIFYSQNNFKAAISVQNLFNSGIEDEEVTKRSLFSTILLQF